MRDLPGALLVFVFLAFVVPVPSVSHPGRLTLLNLAVFVAAMPVGFWIGRAWSLRIAAPTRAWLISGRVPDSSERELALRQPLQLATVGAVLWALAAVLFAGLNAAYSPATGVEAGGTIAGDHRHPVERRCHIYIRFRRSAGPRNHLMLADQEPTVH